MHDALRQAQIKLTAIDFAFAVGHHLHRAIVEEHQIEIGTVAQLPSTQLAVADHRKTAPLAIVQVRRLPVTGHHLQPCLLDDCVNHRLRQPC